MKKIKLCLFAITSLLVLNLGRTCLIYDKTDYKWLKILDNPNRPKLYNCFYSIPVGFREAEIYLSLCNKLKGSIENGDCDKKLDFAKYTKINGKRENAVILMENGNQENLIAELIEKKAINLFSLEYQNSEKKGKKKSVISISEVNPSKCKHVINLGENKIDMEYYIDKKISSDGECVYEHYVQAEENVDFVEIKGYDPHFLVYNLNFIFWVLSPFLYFLRNKEDDSSIESGNKKRICKFEGRSFYLWSAFFKFLIQNGVMFFEYGLENGNFGVLIYLLLPELLALFFSFFQNLTFKILYRKFNRKIFISIALIFCVFLLNVSIYMIYVSNLWTISGLFLSSILTFLFIKFKNKINKFQVLCCIFVFINAGCQLLMEIDSKNFFNYFYLIKEGRKNHEFFSLNTVKKLK